MNEAFYKYAKNIIETISTDDLEKALTSAGFVVTRRPPTAQTHPKPHNLDKDGHSPDCNTLNSSLDSTCSALECSQAVWEDDIGNAGDTFTRCKTCGTYQGNTCRLRAFADVAHTVWLKPTDAAIFDLYETSDAGQDFQVSASSQKTSTHTVPFVRAAVVDATPAGAGECGTCCGIGYFVKNKRSGERIESACVSCNGSGAFPDPFNSIASQSSLAISTNRQSITFAHEVDGPWRLELNGVTISRHDNREQLEEAIEALRAAVARRAMPRTTVGTPKPLNK